jgi:Rrf2 family protein
MVMATSTRFTAAVHILTTIAVHEGTPVPSERIAHSVNTHPSLVRRLLGMLADAGLTTSQLGTGGGALLARPADQISLLEVFQAVEQETLIAVHNCTNKSCMVAENILPTLHRVILRAQSAMFDELASVTIEDIRHDVKLGSEGICPALPHTQLV